MYFGGIPLNSYYKANTTNLSFKCVAGSDGSLLLIQKTEGLKGDCTITSTGTTNDLYHLYASTDFSSSPTLLDVSKYSLNTATDVWGQPTISISTDKFGNALYYLVADGYLKVYYYHRGSGRYIYLNNQYLLPFSPNNASTGRPLNTPYGLGYIAYTSTEDNIVSGFRLYITQGIDF